jgi:carbon storage regulator
VLILTRRVGESIVIGDDVVVTVVEVRGDSVRIGIDAPRSVDVHREEVYRELRSVNQQAASPDPGAVEALTDLISRSAKTARPGGGAGTVAAADPPGDPAGDSVGDSAGVDPAALDPA